MEYVVILHEVMRQTGPENVPFVELLSRLREGRCTDSDYAMLNQRLVSNSSAFDRSAEEWISAPIIVYDNAIKDALNEAAAQAFANRTGQPLNWYRSVDKSAGKTIRDGPLKSKLEGMHSGQTKQRLGRIPLVLGMPVIVSQNFDVEGGVVNGSTGILKKIRYQSDPSSGDRLLTSIVVEIPDCSEDELPNLPSHHMAILQDTVELYFQHPHSKKKCQIKRTQVPVLPGFAMTSHKAQGQSLSHVIVDLESCSGTEAPYVMASRATSLQGLLILRPFRRSKISCRLSQENRQEASRLRGVQLKTIIHCGSTEEEVSARCELQQMKMYSELETMLVGGKSSGNNDTPNEIGLRDTASAAAGFAVNEHVTPERHIALTDRAEDLNNLLGRIQTSIAHTPAPRNIPSHVRAANIARNVLDSTDRSAHTEHQTSLRPRIRRLPVDDVQLPSPSQLSSSLTRSPRSCSPHRFSGSTTAGSVPMDVDGDSSQTPTAPLTGQPTFHGQDSRPPRPHTRPSNPTKRLHSEMEGSALTNELHHSSTGALPPPPPPPRKRARH